MLFQIRSERLQQSYIVFDYAKGSVASVAKQLPYLTCRVVMVNRQVITFAVPDIDSCFWLEAHGTYAILCSKHSIVVLDGHAKLPL